MDDVLEQLVATVITPILDEDTKSNYEYLYKNCGKFSYQEERRKEMLEIQKKKRSERLDQQRGILDLVKEVEEIKPESIWDNNIYYSPSIYVPGFHNLPSLYNHVLMLSEWMVEKPEDFDENWYVVPCPKGTRMLVVASKGTTKCYTKYGRFRFAEHTALPGGNPCEQKYMDKCCVLDCFYNDKDNTMYVLDILAWNSQPMTDGETEFRNFWLKTQLGVITNLKSINYQNKIIFSLLPKIECSTESFNEFMGTCPVFPDNQPTLDGLLFYHKKAHYSSGETPLVGWLYPFMVPEVLGSEYKINALHLLNKPENYINQADYIEKFQEKHEKRNKFKKQGRKNSNKGNCDEENGAMEIGCVSGFENNNHTTKTVGTEKMDAEFSICSKN